MSSINHPSWCAAEECSATPSGGTHRSKPTIIRSAFTATSVVIDVVQPRRSWPTLPAVEILVTAKGETPHLVRLDAHMAEKVGLVAALLGAKASEHGTRVNGAAHA